MGSFEKASFRLNVFVQLSSWIYAGMKKNKNVVVHAEVDYIEIDNGCYYDVWTWNNHLKYYQFNAKIKKTFRQKHHSQDKWNIVFTKDWSHYHIHSIWIRLIMTLVKSKRIVSRMFRSNHQRSRRVFLCFYSAICKLTSVRFQIFAYNSRTVRSSYVKFWQQFEINKLHVLYQISRQLVKWLWF